MSGVRRIVFALLVTVTAVVLLFSYRTSTGGVVPTAAAAGAGIVSQSPATAAAAAPTDSSATASAAPPTPTPTSGSVVVVNGSTVDTRWGPVQVQITLTDGVITAATTLVVPDGNNRDQQINARAVPILTAETVEADGAQIDTVSGATVTSDGYITSLQAALDLVRAPG